MNPPNLRRKIGCWLHERWRMEMVLRAPNLARRMGLEWPDLHNRHELVTCCASGPGRVCHWKNSSFLTVSRFFPETGARLLRHAWTGRESQPVSPVSIILPVRGEERAAAVRIVANALVRMAGSSSEVLVCEHDSTPRFARNMAPGVRHVFVPAAEGEAFNKSRAMNAGACAARHPVLVLHDADVVAVPDFLCQSFAILEQGWEAVRPIRFLFLLDEADSRDCHRMESWAGVREVALVQQNFPGIATVIRRDTYLEIGGHDERFEGWGGEDLEFLDRLRTRRLYPGSFLPAVHLWHPPAPQKRSRHGNLELLESILAEPRDRRMTENRDKLRRCT